MWEKWWNLYLPIPSGREVKAMARLSAYRKRLKVSVSTFSASLIHQHDIAEWNGKKGAEKSWEQKLPLCSASIYPCPVPPSWKFAKRKILFIECPSASWALLPFVPEKKLKALIGKSMVNFETESWHSPASNKFINASEKGWTSSAGSLGCSKSKC